MPRAGRKTAGPGIAQAAQGAPEATGSSLKSDGAAEVDEPAGLKTKGDRRGGSSVAGRNASPTAKVAFDPVAYADRMLTSGCTLDIQPADQSPRMSLRIPPLDGWTMTTRSGETEEEGRRLVCMVLTALANGKGTGLTLSLFGDELKGGLSESDVRFRVDIGQLDDEARCATSIAVWIPGLPELTGSPR